MAHAMEAVMSFLTPLFLLGLAGLAVPVIIHLIQRERKNVVQFPSLMFLRRIPYQSVRRRRIRNWLLLAAAAGGAGADRGGVRAAVPAAAGARGGGGRRRARSRRAGRRSYSMGYGDRWTRATAAARERHRRRRAGGSRVGRVLRVGRRGGAAIDIRSRPAEAAVARRQAGRRRDAVRPGAEAGRQHPQRVVAAAARSDPDLRFPAQRLAGGRRCAAARRRGAHRRADQRCRHRERERDARCRCSARPFPSRSG